MFFKKQRLKDFRHGVPVAEPAFFFGDAFTKYLYNQEVFLEVYSESVFLHIYLISLDE